MANGYKSGGRKAGTPNKMTKELRTIINEIIKIEFELLPDLLTKMKPKDRIDVLVKLLPYTLPKIKDEPINVSLDKTINIPIIKWTGS